MVELYRFGPFELRPEQLQLRRGEALLKVEPKPIEVLAELVRNAGELVTKNDLMESVWAGRVVTESVIARCVAKLRAALEDEAQTLILTVHSYGYRFTGEVRHSTEASAQGRGQVAANVSLRVGDAPPLRPSWRLLRPLNEDGGVWVAQHEKTDEKRVFKFALEPQQIRILKRELTIHRVLRRGLGERDDVARLLDYNLEALPYFLEMEYYREGSLSDWCAAAGGAASIPLELRVELVAQAAESLAAAHALGVLHLDIKPSNLLIWISPDGRPHIRWTDFGNSRLLEPQRLSELGITRLASTRTLGIDGPAEGTLHYIAPELFKGETATVRSDLYAMGVMLYQLVAGDLRRPMAAGWELNIADEVLRADVAATANGDPAQRMSSADELAKRLRTIEQRRVTLDAERALECESAELRRKLDDARARRPWLIAAGAALCAGLAMSLWFYRNALQSRDQARRETAIAEGVSRFIAEDVLGASSPFNPSVRRDIRIADALDRAVSELDQRPLDSPLVEAAVRDSISYTYMQMANYAAAAAQTRKAVELYTATLGADDSRTVHAQYLEAEDLMFDSKYALAEQVLDRLDFYLMAHPRADPGLFLARDALRGSDHFRSERYAQALPFYDRALAEEQRVHPGESAGLATRQQLMALAYAHLGRFSEADRLANQALENSRRAAEPGAATSIALAREAYGVVLYLQQRYPEAERELSESHAVLAGNLGDDEEESVEGLDYLGRVYLSTGRPNAGVLVLRQAHQNAVSRFSENSRDAAVSLADLAAAELDDGRRQAGLDDLRRAVTALRNILGNDAPSTQMARYRFASAELQGGAGVPDITTLRSGLDAAALSLEAPNQPWEARLALLDAQIQLAAGNKSGARQLLTFALDGLRNETGAGAEADRAHGLLATLDR